MRHARLGDPPPAPPCPSAQTLLQKEIGGPKLKGLE